jgi:glycine cleavage system aminomethyltransferase T
MSAVEEHLATRRSAGVFDFSFMGLYEFYEKSELQRLQTRNLEHLVPGQIAYTLLINDDGAVLIDATVWRLDAERFWLFTGRRAGFGGHDVSGAFAILALQGPASGWILARLLGPDTVTNLRYFRFLEKDGLIVARLASAGSSATNCWCARRKRRRCVTSSSRPDATKDCAPAAGRRPTACASKPATCSSTARSTAAPTLASWAWNALLQT